MSKRVLYLVGPTYSGKSSIATSLQENYGYGSVMSTTTRMSRLSDNRSFTNFIDRGEFNELIKDNKFLEHATYANEYYGTLESSMLQGFKDSLLAVKVIEVNGLVQILKSGFHETSGIDFFIVYINPMFDGYEDHIKNRNDWEIRLEEDKALYSIFKKQINGLAPNNKHKIVYNKGSLSKVVSDVNNLCIFSDRDYKFLRNMMQIPKSITISKDPSEFDYSLTIIDSNLSARISNYYLTLNKDLDFVDYMGETFKEHIHYITEGYIAMSLLNYGMLVVLCKKGSIMDVQEKIP